MKIKDKEKKKLPEKAAKKVTIAVFCVLLYGFAAASVLSPDASYSVRERDSLTTLADVTEDGDLQLVLSDIAAGDFQETYEEYVDDQFFLRDSWIDLSSSLSVLLGKKDINGVYIGSDGYLLERYTDEYFLDLEGDAYDAEDGLTWEYNAEALSEFLVSMAEEYGSDSVQLLLIPAKANVLTDALPALASVYPEEEIVETICDLIDELAEDKADAESAAADAANGTDEASEADTAADGTDAVSEAGTATDDANETSETEETDDTAADGISDEGCLSDELVLDLTDALSAHQDEYIYYRTDHHWTTLGAYYAYAAYMELCGLDAESLNSYETETTSSNFLGTTYNKLHIAALPDTITLYHSDSTENVTVEIDDGELVSDSLYFCDQLAEYTDAELLQMAEDGEDVPDPYSVFLNGNTQKIVIETGADTGRTLLLIKDSFANSFVPFLCGTYDTIILYDDRYEGDNDIETILSDYADQITDVLVLYNIEKFMENTSFSLGDY